ncbi:sigma-54-dependent Fis family transcriptional regulator [candidate division KSB1 bacterium]|nr:sigma-54-dependent Fis family transcriptional regulator [candidate division KSB1 bacterium]
MEKKKILVIDDDSLMRDFLLETLTRMNFSVTTAVDGRSGIEEFKKDSYDLVLSDIRMPDISGMEVLKHVKEADSDKAVIMMTAYGTIDNAVEAMKQGAVDYITKPFSADSIEMAVKKVFKYINLEEENRILRKEIDGIYGFDQIIGKSTKMKKIFEVLETVSKSSATVFIQGPSGTGKELVARAIHYNSPRFGKPFIKTNCAALPEGLMESELFGHEKGAFTGALKTRKGRFEVADGGTLLLDEVTEMRPALQAKLLRVLQEKEFERVGDHMSIPVDVRIIATTNRDIKEEIRKETFREDLYYRLNVIPIILPSLMERKKDIPLLVDHFISKYNKEHGREIQGINDDSMEFLMRLDWPGNVRELENRVERAVIMCKGDKLGISNFVFEDEEFDYFKSYESEDTNITLYEMEKQLIFKTLSTLENNRTKTAETLGISVRTLRNKLNEYKSKNEIDPALMSSL